MLALLHGYLLEGSGSNLWTRSIVTSLCRSGETVHLFCQDNHPELYDFISEFRIHHPDGSEEIVFQRESPYEGKCIMHKPKLGDLLPVYVRDNYEEFSIVVPMIELETEILEKYIQTNIDVVTKVCNQYEIDVLHANHAVLMSTVAYRIKQSHGIPYVIMPHGSAIEYAVKKDERFYKYAEEAFKEAGKLFVIGKEMVSRVEKLFPQHEDVQQKMETLNLGVDTSLFELAPPAKRNSNITQLKADLSGLERGRTTETLNALESKLASVAKDGKGSDFTIQDYIEIIKTASSSYNHKKPDADVEAKLDTLDWVNDKTFLFVGRLINSKGLQAVVGALPDILKSHSNTKLIVVGHGPQREVLECLLWAIRNGEFEMALKICNWGSYLESDSAYPLVEVLDYIDAQSDKEKWFMDAQKVLQKNTVVFTGYLTHDKLCHLFPCCDIAAFPSIVAEAGPLVFLEALACGTFPLGTYFAGMAASIDSVEEVMGREVADKMKLTPDGSKLVQDIVIHANEALDLDGSCREGLRQLAVEKYDWKAVGGKMIKTLSQLTAESLN